MTRRATTARTLIVFMLLALVATAGISGCAKTQSETPKKTEQQPAEEAKPIAMKIGVLPTEDSLPLWVAEDKGYFKQAGLDSIEIVVFQSAQERDAAFASGSIDAFMGDIIAAANLEAGGAPGTILTVMLGGDQSQGRFGVLVSPKAKAEIKNSDDGIRALEKVPVGTSSATIQEYVLDQLMAEAGVVGDDVKVEEVKKVPVRFELLMAGKLQAAALPEPFVTLAEQGGAKIVGDDTKAKSNISQTILFMSDEYLSKQGGTASADAALEAWNLAVKDVNAAPDQYRAMLVEKARLPKPLEATYKVNTYPQSALPSKAEVDAVTGWMRDKGYLKSDISYEDLTLITPKK